MTSSVKQYNYDYIMYGSSLKAYLNRKKNDKFIQKISYNRQKNKKESNNKDESKTDDFEKESNNLGVDKSKIQLPNLEKYLESLKFKVKVRPIFLNSKTNEEIKFGNIKKEDLIKYKKLIEDKDEYNALIPHLFDEDTKLYKHTYDINKNIITLIMNPGDHWDFVEKGIDEDNEKITHDNAIKKGIKAIKIFFEDRYDTWLCGDKDLTEEIDLDFELKKISERIIC